MRLEITEEVFTLVNINKRRTAPLHRLQGPFQIGRLQIFTCIFYGTTRKNEGVEGGGEASLFTKDQCWSGEGRKASS